MDIWTSDQLVLFLTFVIPGFVALKTYSIVQPEGHRDASQQLIDALAYSCVNYAFLAFPIYLVQRHNVAQAHPFWYAAFCAFVVLVAPAAWTLLYIKLRTSRWFQTIAPHPTSEAWHFLFSQRKRYWMIVTLQDGQKIAGLFDAESFASSTPAPKQLYLQEAWEMSAEGGFERPRVDSDGVLILADSIATIELFKKLD